MLNDWSTLFSIIENKPYAKALHLFLDEEYKKYVIYPPREKILNAFAYTDPKNLKVVIIGQDPYFNKNQAMGLSFSVPKGVSLPPSLINIYKEIEDDLLVKMNFNNGDLTYLAKQNVLLLNAYLTVRKGAPLSHKSSLYRKFQKDVFAYLDTLSQPIVFILWGSFAQSFAKYIHNPNRLILKSGHPSPLSANRGLFFNNHHFSKANSYLTSFGLTEIDWCNKKTKL